MSLAIDPETVTAVLLADGWHEVGSDFDLDSYEFVEPAPDRHSDGFVLHGGGHSDVCATGFSFSTPDHLCKISGPLTSILAVRTTVAR